MFRKNILGLELLHNTLSNLQLYLFFMKELFKWFWIVHFESCSWYYANMHCCSSQYSRSSQIYNILFFNKMAIHSICDQSFNSSLCSPTAKSSLLLCKSVQPNHLIRIEHNLISDQTLLVSMSNIIWNKGLKKKNAHLYGVFLEGRCDLLSPLFKRGNIRWSEPPKLA